jgi:OmpA family
MLGNRHVQLRGHDIGKLVKTESRVVTVGALSNFLTILRPKIPEHQIGAFRSGKSREPIDSTVDPDPVSHLDMEGHTDSKQYPPGAIYTNWELSADRANAARRLMQENGIRADQVTQVRGFADQKLRKADSPMDPSNRRISLIVQYLAKKPEPEQPGGEKAEGEKGAAEAEKGAEKAPTTAAPAEKKKD